MSSSRRAGPSPDWIDLTDGVLDLHKLAIDSPWRGQGNRYEPTPVGALDLVLDALDLPLARYTFVDLGSGKGRVLWEATTRPFGAVVGVEFARDLHDQATALLSGQRTRTSGPARSVHADATSWAPDPGPLVVYLFNPFSAAVLSRALNLLLATRAGGDDIWLLYRYPEHRGVVDRDSRWRFDRDFANGTAYHAAATG